MCTHTHVHVGISATTLRPMLHHKWAPHRSPELLSRVGVDLRSSLEKALAEEGMGTEGSAGASPGRRARPGLERP